MKLRLLGAGTSSGVPRIGNDWGDCDPAEPKNRRTRASLLVEGGGARVLVDTSPDLREQLLAADVATVDAIIWTHDHADHTHGIDDVRQIYHARGRAVPGYARPDTRTAIERKFDYVVGGKDGYPPTVDLRDLNDLMVFDAMTCQVVEQPHGTIASAGLRFEADGHVAGYATDFSEMTDAMLALYRGLDVWIVDALRHRPHPTHPHLEQVIGWVAELKPKRTILMHMDHSMDYAALRLTLPAGIEPGYDGDGDRALNGSQASDLVFYLLVLILPLSALLARRLPISSVLKMTAGWVAIFALLLILVGQRERFRPLWDGARNALTGEEQIVQGAMVRIPMAADGHFWAEVRLNGVARRMLIDSGATSTALTGATARAAGVTIDDFAPDIVIETANGAIVAKRGVVTQLQLGGITARNLPVVTAAAFGETDVIGMNFLSRLDSWRVEGRTLILEPKHH